MSTSGFRFPATTWAALRNRILSRRLRSTIVPMSGLKWHWAAASVQLPALTAARNMGNPNAVPSAHDMLSSPSCASAGQVSKALKSAWDFSPFSNCWSAVSMIPGIFTGSRWRVDTDLKCPPPLGARSSRALI